MGYLMEKHGLMMPSGVPKGTCEMCAVAHDPGMPHNRDSLCYQYKFYDLHGRFPTWMDAMAHCTEEMQQMWIQALKERGVDLGEKAEKEGAGT